MRAPGTARSRRLGALLMAGAILTLGSGCAYFNTFYFAKRYYAQAEKLVRESESDKLPPEAIRKYDLAIKQCGKVLTFHGDSRWVDDAVFLMGASYYGKREFETALKKFGELIANYPDTDLAVKAHYMSGLCHYERHNYEMMEAAFHQTLELDPGFEKRDDILFTMARAAETRRDKPEAVRRYRELVEEYPGSERADEGLLRIGDLYFDEGKADSAYMAYEELANTARNDETFRQAQMKAAQALVRLDRADESIRMLRRLIPDDGGTTTSREDWPAQARIHLAQAYNSVGDHEDALEVLRQVTEKYSFSTYASEAQFQIGYTYEVYMDSLASARTAYEQVAKLSTRSVFKEQAATRARNLQQLESLAVQAVGDSLSDEEKQAEARLKIAELYLFSQDKVEEALQEYRGIVDEFPETSVAPRAAYGAAWIRLNRLEGREEEALQDFRDLIARYPASAQARGALDLLVMESADTAGLRDLLVEAAPDTAAAADSAAQAGSPGGPLVTPPADSLRTDRASAPADSLGLPGTPGAGALRPSWADSAGQASSPQTPDSVPAAGGPSPADSLRRPGDRGPAGSAGIRRPARPGSLQAPALTRAQEDSVRKALTDSIRALRRGAAAPGDPAQAAPDSAALQAASSDSLKVLPDSTARRTAIPDSAEVPPDSTEQQENPRRLEP